jgi:hypothetical protein
VTPKPDGTADVKVEYFPDPEQAYTIKTSSFLSSYTLDVKTKNGLLESVSLDAGAGAVAKAAVDAAASVADKAFQAEKTRKEQEAAAQKTAADTEKQLRDTVLTAQAKLQQLEQLKSDPNFAQVITQADILKANLELTEAKVKLASFLGVKVSNIDADIGSGSFDAPARRTEMAPGPVLFRIVPTAGGVTLNLADGPRSFPTATIGARPQPSPAAFGLLDIGVPPLVRKAGESVAHEYRFSAQIGDIDRQSSKLVHPTGNQTPITDDLHLILKDGDASRLIMTVPPKLPDGVYELRLQLTPKGDQPKEVNPKFELSTKNSN